VRLSYKAVHENAVSIAQYLNITASERAVTTLPFSYSYGLSIINSHLYTGASIVLTDASIISKEFWETIRLHQPTSLAGVPYTYQMLHRTGFTKMDFPSLRKLTQAGGRLDPKLIRTFGEFAEQKGIKFFVMYGQTEASPRISYVPSERLLDKVGSIGVAIPGGRLEVADDTGELVYSGPNVMMGYAEARPALALGDELNGVLRTGDLGYADDDGYFFITGRLKRFIKMGGNRIGLDEVEKALQDALNISISVGGKDDSLLAFLESDDASKVDLCKELLKTKFAIHHTMVRLKLVSQLPLLPTGKKDYSALLDQ
jgi:acyl-coenzyme A synthetase/AMP-(fatty) acid ligase